MTKKAKLFERIKNNPNGVRFTKLKDKIKYPIVVYPADGGGYVAEVPTLKGCLAQGETIQDCLSELEAVIALWLDTARINNLTIPSVDSIISRIKSISAN